MINKYVMKKTPTIEACQWLGVNVEEMDEFLDTGKGNHGYIQGRYVQIGWVDEYHKPTVLNVSIGNYVVRDENGKYSAMTAQELFDKYILAD